nr:MAG TPA: hypothetical protein [Caudoviricetes sp.]
MIIKKGGDLVIKKSDKSPIHIGFYNLIYVLIISEKK